MFAVNAVIIPVAWPRDDTMIVEKMKVLFKQGGVWDEFSDGFQRRGGNRSRVGLALCDYGIRPGHSFPPRLYPLPLLFETREGRCPNVHPGAGTDTRTGNQGHVRQRAVPANVP